MRAAPRMTDRDAVEHAAQEPQTSDWHRPRLGLFLIAVAVAILVFGLVQMPRDTSALPFIARHAMEIALPVWGQAEVVSEVVYGSRGFDTFGETFLLLAAVVSVTVLSRPRERRDEYVGEASAGRSEQRAIRPGDEPDDPAEADARAADQREEGDGAPDTDSSQLGDRAPERALAMTVVVRVAVRIAAVPLSVMSIYLAAWGYTPGGGFPAGAVVCGVVLLLYTAFGRHAIRRVVRPSLMEPIELAGAAAIVLIGLGGLIAQGSMFANFVHLAQPRTIRAGGTN